MNVIYSLESIPNKSGGIFLAGPTFRDWRPTALRWRLNALDLLQERNYTGNVYLPEYRDGHFSTPTIEEQCSWEHHAMHAANTIVFWVPRNLNDLPGFTTNVEFGYWMNSNKHVLYGRPRSAEKVRYLDWLYLRCRDRVPFDNLPDLIKGVLL